MRDKQSKKVVIINDISSDTVERAILILRDSGRPETVCDSSIVAQAQHIIESYAKTVEKAQEGMEKRMRKARREKGKKRNAVVYVLGAMLFFISVWYVVSEIFSKIMVNI